jgi:hypothetical protein
MAFAQELLAFFLPACLRDVMEDGVNLKRDSSSVYLYGYLASNSYSTTGFVFLPPRACGTRALDAGQSYATSIRVSQ